MFVPSRAKLASYRPMLHRRGNLANSVVPTLLVCGSRLAFRATMCRAERDLEACWNSILTILNLDALSTVTVRLGHRERICASQRIEGASRLMIRRSTA